jgi:hypothetical protein
MLAEPGQEILRITGFHTIPTELIETENGSLALGEGAQILWS